MARVQREWVEAIKYAIAHGYDTGKITSLNDVDKVALDVWNSLRLDAENNRLRTIATFMAKTNNPILVDLRKKAAEIHLPITNNSPIGHLPISRRPLIRLQRNGLGKVGSVVSFLLKEGPDGLREKCRGLGKKGTQEILDALVWAGIEIPKEGSEAIIEQEFSEIGVVLSPNKIPFLAQRTIQLDPGDTFTTGIDSDGLAYVRIVSPGKSFNIVCRKITITAEG